MRKIYQLLTHTQIFIPVLVKLTRTRLFNISSSCYSQIYFVDSLLYIIVLFYVTTLFSPSVDTRRYFNFVSCQILEYDCLNNFLSLRNPQLFVCTFLSLFFFLLIWQLVHGYMMYLTNYEYDVHDYDVHYCAHVCWVRVQAYGLLLCLEYRMGRKKICLFAVTQSQSRIFWKPYSEFFWNVLETDIYQKNDLLFN